MAKNPSGLSRRGVLQAASVPLFVPAAALGRGGATAPSDRVNLAGLGIGNRGARALQSFLSQPDVQFRAICDVRNERREAIKSMADKKYGNNDCVMYSDQYELWAQFAAGADPSDALTVIYSAESSPPCSEGV